MASHWPTASVCPAWWRAVNQLVRQRNLWRSDYQLSECLSVFLCVCLPFPSFGVSVFLSFVLQGPVVQSILSLTSLLRVNELVKRSTR